MLNIGGVLGICDSATPDKGQAVRLQSLGYGIDLSLSRRAHGVPARADTRPWITTLRSTCAAYRWWRWPATLHGSGQDRGGSAIIARMRHRGLIVDAFQSDRRIAAA